MEMLSRWVERLILEDGADLYHRYKGVMAVKGKEEKFVFQGVVFNGKKLDIEFHKYGKSCQIPNELR